jgi:hypothetical protein
MPSPAIAPPLRARTGAAGASALLLTLGLISACGPRKTPLNAAAAAAPCEGTALVVIRNQTADELEVVMLERTTWTLLGTARGGRTEFILPESTPRSRLGVRTQKGVWVPTNSAIGASSTGLVRLDTECRG